MDDERSATEPEQTAPAREERDDPDAGAPTVAWWFVGAGIVLLLPRQWVAACGCFLLAGVIAAIARLRRR
jgi:hypothetical protein